MPAIMRDHTIQLIVFCLAAVCMLGGCVERLITVKSKPAGAIVYLNDEEIGRTPATVPFRFYGVYDVRLEAEPRWMSIQQAAAAFGVTEAEISQWTDQERLDSRESDSGAIEVKVYYRPLWTKHEAKAPWWEAPGPDLIAEALPDQTVHLEWDFELEPVDDIRSEAIIERANQMKKQLLGQVE